jgi:hypothetical protein
MARESAKMHDMIGSGGMLRGLVALWTTQMLWFMAAMTVTVAVTAMAELLFAGYARRARVTLPLRTSVTDARPGALSE